ncbi:sugar phosphate nucleotidyltransferase [Priestia megaterium]|uniref:sugar phosphate nucleotidyltransferase n=1 Tax=Priestia megaterium TaxID=1404 RepID=UPI003D093224
MNNEVELAPVALFCYNRPQLTSKTLKALELNDLARQTNLYVFIDGPKVATDKQKIEEIIKIVKSLKGFKKVNIIQSPVNKGLANSIITGVTEIIKKYNKVIVLEDDLITHSSFLSYMNKALRYYKDKSNIWSISGYTPNMELPDDYQEDVFVTLRGSSWGWATWKDRWELIEWEWGKKDFDEIFSKKKDLDLVGEDIYYLTKDYKEKLIDSWAIRWTNAQFKFNKYTVFPRHTFVQNEGFGSDSTHGSLSSKFKTKLSKQNIEFNLVDVTYQLEIERLYANLYKLEFHNKISIFLKRIKIYKLMKKILKKIR